LNRDLARYLDWFRGQRREGERARRGASHIAEESGGRFLTGGVWFARRKRSSSS
jgi:hypothetical protein